MYEPDVYARHLDLDQRFVHQLRELITAGNPGFHSLEVGVGSAPGDVIEKLRNLSFSVKQDLISYLVINADVELDMAWYQRVNHGRELGPDYLDAFAAVEVASAIEDALLLSRLGLPGVVHSLEGLATTSSGGQRIKALPIFHDLLHPRKGEPRWPEIQVMDLVSVREWTRKIGFKDSAFSSTKAGKAFAAFTHITTLGTAREGEALFRAMQGLEAFYCDGVGDLRRQLAEKVKLWLGPWQEGKNIVGHLYDARSKFIHGSDKLEFAGSYVDPYEEDSKHVLHVSDSTAFAVRLLVATLQKCIERGASDVEWRFDFTIRKEN